MKPRFKNHSCNRIGIAAAALIGCLALTTEAALAATPPPPLPEPTSWVPRGQLTPYQIVSDAGTCAEAVRHAAWPQNYVWSLTLAPCNSARNQQKFYVVDNGPSLTDFVPQTDVVPADSSVSNAGIVLAYNLDRGDYMDPPNRLCTTTPLSDSSWRATSSVVAFPGPVTSCGVSPGCSAEQPGIGSARMAHPLSSTKRNW